MAEALIIDDNRTTADALCQMLKVLGFKARPAYGSGAAMALLGTGFTPHFVCLDINMPQIITAGRPPSGSAADRPAVPAGRFVILAYASAM